MFCPLCSSPLHRPLLSPKQKQNRPTSLLDEVAGCATGSARPSKRPSFSGELPSLYSGLYRVVPFLRRNASKGSASTQGEEGAGEEPTGGRPAGMALPLG